MKDRVLAGRLSRRELDASLAVALAVGQHKRDSRRLRVR
jgi:hypothetical protein